jgi:hypothetical protein
MQSKFFFYFLKKFDPTCNNNTGRAINYDSLKQMTTMYLALPLTCFFFYLKSGELSFELLESNLWTWDDNDTHR